MSRDDVHTVTAIARVHNRRRTLEDDHWGRVESVIELDPSYPAEAFDGLEAFSHIQVIYGFHRVTGSVHTGARHPRGRQDWPRLGIFAQRAKRRPNRLGLSCCRLVARDGRRLRVLDLDAIDGTPVLDVKPYFRQFGPRFDGDDADTRQPSWVDELMEHYWSPGEDPPRS